MQAPESSGVRGSAHSDDPHRFACEERRKKVKKTCGKQKLRSDDDIAFRPGQSDRFRGQRWQSPLVAKWNEPQLQIGRQGPGLLVTDEKNILQKVLAYKKRFSYRY
jgi:hypothetical protein